MTDPPKHTPIKGTPAKSGSKSTLNESPRTYWSPGASSVFSSPGTPYRPLGKDETEEQITPRRFREKTIPRHSFGPSPRSATKSRSSLGSSGGSRRSPLVGTPRTAASVLGSGSARKERFRRSLFPSDEAEDLEMESLVLDEPEDEPKPPKLPTDPMEKLYKVVKLGELSYTNSVEEDIPVLKEYGFIIDYPNDCLGRGLYGEVYKGKYGQRASELKDDKGHPIRNVEPNKPFACKLVDFKKMGYLPGRTFKSPELIQKTRDAYEVEKRIMTFAEHPNISPIRMAVNMGEEQTYTNLRTGKPYSQHQRIYLIMDLAELGSFKDYIDVNGDNLTPPQRIRLTQDCFWGLKYLHDHNMAHGDIHPGNILMFEEDGRVVAKWTDFGQGYVNEKGEFNPSSNVTLINKMETDCTKFYTILSLIWEGRYREDEDDYEQKLCDQFIEMADEIRRQKYLDNVFLNYEDILNWTDDE